MLVAPAVFAINICLGCEITGGGAVFYSSACRRYLCWGMTHGLGAFFWCSSPGSGAGTAAGEGILGTVGSFAEIVFEQV